MKKLTSAERLIVAADFKMDPTKGQNRQWVIDQVLALADKLSGIGCYIKVNSALRAYGYDLITVLHNRGLKVFADLKLYDIPETLATDAAMLAQLKPELLTVACSAGKPSIQALVLALPGIEILAVTVLTSLTDAHCFDIHGSSIGLAISNLAQLARDSGVGGVVGSAREAGPLRLIIGNDKTINTPAIRPVWSIVVGDDQNPERIMTPAAAITAGVDRIVVGRPILRAPNPRDAVMRTIEEIESAMTSMAA